MTTKNKVGRPAVFTPEILDEILLSIAEGESERSIFNREKYPAWRTWTKYKRENPEFIPHYVQAKEDGYKVWESKMIERAEDDSRDVLIDSKGNQRSDNTPVNRDRLIIDTMKWQMSKIMSKVYGDKVQQELSGPEGGPIPGLKVVIEK